MSWDTVQDNRMIYAEEILIDPPIKLPVIMGKFIFEASKTYPNTEWFQPADMRFAFGESNNHKGQYSRAGNVKMISHYPYIEHEGTLYVSTDCAYILVTGGGMITASGSAGAFPREYIPEPIEPEAPVRVKSRFEDIIT